MPETSAPYLPNPELHTLALFELAKGLLALAAAASIEMFGTDPIRGLIHDLIARFNLDPEHGALPTLLKAINPDALHLASLVLALYALIRIAEAWGLWRAKAWASWLGCVSTALYLPLDLYALYHHHGWHTWAVLIINLLVIIILARDLQRRRRG